MQYDLISVSDSLHAHKNDERRDVVLPLEVYRESFVFVEILLSVSCNLLHG